MKKLLISALLVSATAASAQSVTTTSVNVTPLSQPVELGLSAGYAGGLGAEVSAHFPRVIDQFGVRASVAMNAADFNRSATVPGTGVTDAEWRAAAAASGSPVTSGGRNLVFGLDGTYPLAYLGDGMDVSVYAGARYGLFERHISQDAQSNTFSSSAFGLGGGLQLAYPLSSSMSLYGDLGVDHYLPSAINISGSSTGSLNPGEAGYDDTRAWTNIPGTVFKAKAGVKFRL